MGSSAYSTQASTGLAQILDRLADGESVQLGEFGNQARTTDADEQASLLREVADELRVTA
jgi:hypothetical protein